MVQEVEAGGHKGRWLFITATYAQVGWHPRQISEALRRYRQWCERRGFQCRVGWRFECGEKRGRPHYHLLTWVPARYRMPNWDKQRWWPHGATKTEVARAPVGYMAKYAAKPPESVAQGWGIKGARSYGLIGLGAAGRRYVRYWLLPQWLQDLCSPESLPLRVSGWWRVGEREYLTPWELLRFENGGAVMRWRGVRWIWAPGKGPHPELTLWGGAGGGAADRATWPRRG